MRNLVRYSVLMVILTLGGGGITLAGPGGSGYPHDRDTVGRPPKSDGPGGNVPYDVQKGAHGQAGMAR